MSPTENFSTSTYAIVSESADLDTDGRGLGARRRSWGPFASAARATRPVFVGIAPAADVDGYLEDVEHAVVDRLERRAALSRIARAAHPARPAQETFWAASTTGAGEQTLDWDPEDGTWRVVVMNADGIARSRRPTSSIGAELDPVIWIGLGLLGQRRTASPPAPRSRSRGAVRRR